MNIVVSRQLDARTQDIFVPILQMRNIFEQMRSGEVLELISDDPGALSDIKAWSNLTGNKILEIRNRDDVNQFFIQKKFKEVVMADFKIDETLDCSGMLCPMPVVKTNKALKQLGVGQTLEMISTDPGSIPDMEAWARQTGHELLEAKDENSKYRFVIKKTH